MDIVSKINGNTLSATEFNQIPTELETLITSSGQTVSDSILNQDTIAVSRYTANNFYIDSGSTNTYILTLAASMTNPVSSTVGYFIGMTIRFRAGNANSGASTVNVNSAGVKNLKKEDGTTDLSAGDIPTDIDVMFRYNGTAFCLVRNAASLPEAIAGTNNTKFLTPYLASNLPFFNAFRSTPLTLTTGVATKITALTVDNQIGNYFNAGSSSYTPPAGFYAFNLLANATSVGNFEILRAIYKNGSPATNSLSNSSGGQTNKQSFSGTIYLNGTDSIEIYITMNGGSTLTLSAISEFSMYKIR